MLETLDNVWIQFLEFIKNRISISEYQNWFEHINVISSTKDEITLEVPNIFVREYILDNYKKDMLIFLPTKNDGELSVNFIVKEEIKEKRKIKYPVLPPIMNSNDINFNSQYTFENYIEGPSNQFVKSAAFSVAQKPGNSFNPLFIHGGVGLGKTHLLHGIGNYIKNHNKKYSVKCITTEAFINDLIMNLRNKSVDKMKKFYRNLDVFLVDDIQFLQNKENFEEEFCNTFESLINQNKQIVIVSDKPPAQLKLSQRLIARMEWGLVAHIEVPDLETRVAILKHKASFKGLTLSDDVCFFIAERIFSNIRQLEGAINRLAAYYKITNVSITKEICQSLLNEISSYVSTNKISVENILKSVALVFEIKVSDLKGESRLKNIALARQVAMYLAKEHISDSLQKIAQSFGGKTHSTLLHGWKKISSILETDENLSRQIQMIKRNLSS
ncbi:MAG: chromosomal replication initiator protein DnaA [Chlamydiae bacterium RIFCSPHIGHO2_12_FULL_27_8]|nr:MAG: chromosomal replication initiator protein DnaA [Chlamydiae bacterium RIFCSPHIGHO2_12_FULL_27_8]